MTDIVDRYRDHGITVLTGHRAVRIDRESKVVISNKGTEVPYDHVVLSTGSYAWVPPIPGAEHKNVFVYRTIEDCQQIIEAASSCKAAAVIGGGLLGLEGAKACYDMNVPEVHVVEGAPRLMVRQLDQEGGDLLKRKIEALAEAPQTIHTHCDAATKQITCDQSGRVTGLDFKDGSRIECEMVIICTGVRPRDELAKECGLEVGARGGIVVDDSLATSDPDIFAIGEVACHKNMCYGLVNPGYEMADLLATNLTTTTEARFGGGDLSCKLKLMGVDVASFGIYDGHPLWKDALPFSYYDPFKGTAQAFWILVLTKSSKM